MFKKNNGQLTIGEHLIYENLPEDILSRINKLIGWKPFEKILGSLHPAKVGRKAYNPVMMFKILIIHQIYGHSDPEMELMLKATSSTAASLASPLLTLSPIIPLFPASALTSNP